MYNPYDTDNYPVRKNTRLPGYDYSTENYYFVTICTYEKRCIFGLPEDRTIFGSIAHQAVPELESHYPDVKVDQYVVMPNHVHLILYLTGGKSRLDSVVGSYKSYVSRQIHRIAPDQKVWQRSFHDHIIRDQRSYENIWNYIAGNPGNWDKDCFYTA